MRKGIIVHIDENAKRFGRGSDPDPSKQPVQKTYGAKSCITEGIAAGGRQGEDKGNDGGTNHV